MTPRSTARRLASLLILALLSSLPTFAQTAGTQPAAAEAGTSQVVSSSAAASQPGAAQTIPSTGGPSRAAPPQATSSPAAPSQTASAPANSGPSYDVEIVVFRAKVALGQPESWAAETTASATVAGGEAASGSGSAGQLLTVLPAADYRLTAIESRLRSSGTYLPVAHAAWVQTASAWGTRAGIPLDSLGINVPGLTGVMFLQRGEFLHLGMTLNYTMQDPPPGLKASPGTTFVMNENRRVRFYQRNYYDHPAFGVIALVTPTQGPRPPGR